MARKPSEETNKVMDVSMPGKGKIMPTSRPVIAPIAKDTVSDSGKPAQDMAEVKPLEAPSVSRKVIQPISGDNQDTSASDGESAKPGLPIEVTGDELDADPESVNVTTSEKSVPSEPAADSSEQPAPTEETVEEETAKEVASEPVPVAAQDVSPVIEETIPKKKTIQPTSSDLPKRADEAAADEPQESTEQSPIKEEVTDDKPDVTDTVTAPAEGSDAAGVDALVDSVETKKEAARKADEQAQKAAALDELIASKKYFVPIGVENPGQHAKKQGHGFTVFLLFLLVAVVGGYLAIDAELLDVGIALPYDLIKT
jgi:hypothetical protein